MRRVVVWGLLLGVAILAPRGARAQAPAALPAVDLADLNLRVAEARVVDSLETGKTPIKPQPGMKFVVATLRGSLKAPGHLAVAATGFYALYSEVASNAQEKVAQAKAQAVDLGGEGTWAPQASADYKAPKQVLLEVAIPVPTPVSEFYLIYDTAKGRRRAAVNLHKGVSAAHPQ
ncbi:MAG TPA: hypothetical protein VMM92_05010 [Thermoanaerobaculia bacterium]|nr:hypothetical protein [Thermoanaerobaculia bacterium]